MDGDWRYLIVVFACTVGINRLTPSEDRLLMLVKLIAGVVWLSVAFGVWKAR